MLSWDTWARSPQQHQTHHFTITTSRLPLIFLVSKLLLPFCSSTHCSFVVLLGGAPMGGSNRAIPTKMFLNDPHPDQFFPSILHLVGFFSANHRTVNGFLYQNTKLILFTLRWLEILSDDLDRYKPESPISSCMRSIITIFGTSHRHNLKSRIPWACQWAYSAMNRECGRGGGGSSSSSSSSDSLVTVIVIIIAIAVVVT